MDAENRLMKMGLWYILIRDLLLLMLIGGHAMIYYRWAPRLDSAVGWILGVGAVGWLLIYIRSVVVYRGLCKDDYVGRAIRDEYSAAVIRRADGHGYAAVVVGCLSLILLSVASTVGDFRIDLPYFIVGEGLILLAIATSDLSKIIQFGR